MRGISGGLGLMLLLAGPIWAEEPAEPPPVVIVAPRPQPVVYYDWHLGCYVVETIHDAARVVVAVPVESGRLVWRTSTRVGEFGGDVVTAGGRLVTGVGNDISRGFRRCGDRRETSPAADGG